MAENTTFRNLRLVGWRQFESVDIDFHRRLTVLTGANGSGKSTILNILSKSLGVSRPYLATPEKTKSGIHYLSGIFELSRKITNLLPWNRPSLQHFGQLTYADGNVSTLVIPDHTGIQYELSVQKQSEVKGFHVPSHRLLPAYRQLAPTIPSRGIPPDDAFNLLINESYARYRGDNTDSSLIFRLKEILTAWRAIGEGNSVIDQDLVQQEAYDGFIEILKKVIPAEIGFRNIVIRFPDVLLDTESGTFLLDASSGGLVTIIEIAAMIYTRSIHSDTRRGPFVVTFDEPENHLHPALQRTLLPTLVEAFPQVQFIVATHSPFMVSSLKDSNVYVLRYVASKDDVSAGISRGTSRRVQSVRLDYANRAGTAGEILRDVLGVPVTLPVWVEADLQKIVDEYQARAINDETLSSLRNALEMAGLDGLFSEAVVLLGARR